VRLRRAREKGERRKEKGEGKGSESYSFLPFFLLPSPFSASRRPPGAPILKKVPKKLLCL
jgi:hypothetical protein